MPLDVDDPRCPTCEGPVSATAVWCMHCGADFEATTGDPSNAPLGGSATPAQSDGAGASPDTAPVAAESGALLDPDGLLDDSLTVLVGLLAAPVVASLAFVLFGALTDSAWSYPVGFVAWLGSTIVLVRRRSVQTAFRDACYAVAALVALFPLIAFGPFVGGETLADQIVFFLAAAGILGLVALVIAGVGYVVGAAEREPRR